MKRDIYLSHLFHGDGAISGLIRCVEDPFWTLINAPHHAYYAILPHGQHHSVCLRILHTDEGAPFMMMHYVTHLLEHVCR